MARTSINDIYRKMIRDEEFYQRLLQANSPEESQRLLIDAGFDLDVSYEDVKADLQEMAASGGDVVEEELGGAATERAVEWAGVAVTAAGVVVGAIAIT